MVSFELSNEIEKGSYLNLLMGLALCRFSAAQW